ncbi:GatB/YqeY domain-containing protein [Oenococcus sicerae]|uniref:GatB/YqeY domain-containing protein n=1 Tax=Oenococcus sicerae TaxID=2203724 RepID=A0AAJ1R8J9_9LACO|nr:GatB/YqeY domain-containing protein [Oenococcus sicerae]MDN6899731.1 GatB/YqeY domain-containing protein [Oenococcus sicerae]QAS70421.1 GatB/YqeY domain-containing protein [Oenococcus sicerae]
MSLTSEIQSAIITAMKAKDKPTLSVLRMLKAAISNKQIEIGHELSDEEVIGVLASEVKSRNDSISEFKKGKRDDLVSQTENEIKVLQQYLPAPLSDQELQELVARVISELNANGLKDMGKVMGKLSAQTKGRVDGGKLAAIVKEKLGAQ